MKGDNAVMVDVRNYNESLIGRFNPPGGSGGLTSASKVLDPKMRKSTEFPQWVQDHYDQLQGKKVLMYCTGGIRCEKASAYFKHKGFKKLFQLEGGIIEYARQVRTLNLENKFVKLSVVFK